jgi:hypothetical protein
MGQYANATSVSPEKSQQDIRETLRRYGATKFGVMEEEEKAHVMFEYNRLRIQLTIGLPAKDEFQITENGRKRKQSSVTEAYNQAVRPRWRALLLAIKAKLEAIECGISTIEKEFLAFVVLPDGSQLGDRLMPQIENMAKTGKMPRLLIGAGDAGAIRE